VPRSFVFRRGRHATHLAALEHDVRRMMLPHTALRLRESRRNTMRDFVSVAAPLGVSHFLVLTATERAAYLRLAKTPRGPTLTFRVRSYALCRDVAAAQARPRAPENAFKTPPLLVLQGFSPASAAAAAAAKAGAGAGADEDDDDESDVDENDDEDDDEDEGGQKPTQQTKQKQTKKEKNPPDAQSLRLAGALLQGLFPPLQVAALKLSACQRVVLVSRDAAGPDATKVSVRHYSVSVAPSGLRRPIKDLLTSRRGGSANRPLPDLGGMADAAELLAEAGYGSESEGEDAEAARVALPASSSKKGAAAASASGQAPATRQSRVRLHEIGPRLELEMTKAEAGLCEGQVLWHALRALSPEALAAQREDYDAKAALRAQRRREQEENVRRKQQQARRAEEAEARAREGAAGAGVRAQKRAMRAAANGNNGNGGGAGAADEEDDDAAYFREAVGHEPDEEDMVGMKRGGSGARGGRGGGGRGGGRGRGGGGGFKRGRGDGGGGGGRGGGRGDGGGGKRGRR
jgi:ribosome biogenesis protein SSF1/2